MELAQDCLQLGVFQFFSAEIPAAATTA